MPLYEVRASSGERLLITANSEGHARAIALTRWSRFAIHPSGADVREIDPADAAKGKGVA